MKYLFKKQIVIIIFLLLVFLAFGIIFLLIQGYGDVFIKSVVSPSELVEGKAILFENMNRVSPDSNYVSYVTADNLGMDNSKIWIARNDGSDKKQIAKSLELRFVTSPVFSPDSKKLAYLRIYPFEIMIYDIQTGTQKSVKLSNNDLKTYLNPSLGYGGETYLAWKSENEIGFENTNETPTARYMIDIDRHLIKKDLSYVVSATEKPGEYPTVPHFSQRDPEWDYKQLGACKEESIHSAGCAVTSVAMLFKFYGVDVDPDTLNKMLSSNNAMGYVDECNIKWYIAPNFEKETRIRLKGAYFNEKTFDRLDYELDRGNPVIIGFNYVPFTRQQHWVVVTHRIGNTYYINDPWSLEGEVKTLEDFGGAFDHLIVYEKDPEYFVYKR